MTLLDKCFKMIVKNSPTSNSLETIRDGVIGYLTKYFLVIN